MTIDTSKRPSKTNNIAASKFQKVYIPESSAGLARTHNLIRIEKRKEIQFMKLCAQIRFDDFKKKRAYDQRNDRKLKRADKHLRTVNE
jgi:hypothetical protein